MRFSCKSLFSLMGAGALLLSAVGCLKTSETVEANKLTEDTVGKYKMPASRQPRPKIGCPPWSANLKDKDQRKQIGTEAGDIATTLMFKTKRARVIERTQLPQLLKEQALEGIVKASELAKSGQVKGIDLLMYGKITNFSVKTQSSKRGFGLGRIGALTGRGGGLFGLLDVKKSSTKVTVEIGVDIRLVDPSTGEIVCAEQSEFKKTNSMRALGLDILGANASSSVRMKTDANNRGLLLRLAIDHAIRKMLPDFDDYRENVFKAK
jgi:curli biogenesis system outer membrane secretion channel CsgG